MPRVMLQCPAEDFIDAQILALGFPTCEWRIAEPAAEIAAAGAHEDTRHAGQAAFALVRLIEFGDAHGNERPKAGIRNRPPDGSQLEQRI